jgi:1-acyl-sn-glycerol-3-phosphate acyltransferase
MGPVMKRPMEIIPIGPLFPRKGSRFSKTIARLVLKMTGWRVTGSVPNVPKAVLIGGPHTSNWDFPFGVLSLFVLGLDVHWIGKHTIFRWPFGVILRRFGGIPVNRTSPGALFRDVIRGFEENDSFVFGLSPEGTRSKVTKWKPGFHRIARTAKVPILPASLDFVKREIHFGPLFDPSDNFQEDVTRLQKYYSQFSAKRPELNGMLSPDA